MCSLPLFWLQIRKYGEVRNTLGTSVQVNLFNGTSCNWGMCYCNGPTASIKPWELQSSQLCSRSHCNHTHSPCGGAWSRGGMLKWTASSVMLIRHLTANTTNNFRKKTTRTKGIRTANNSRINNNKNSSHSNSKRGQHSSIDDNKCKNKDAHSQQIQSTSVRYQYVPIWAGHAFSLFHRFVL